MHDLGIYERLTPVVPGAKLFPTVVTKACTRCGETKALDLFWRNKICAHGRQAACVSCAKSGAKRGVDPRIAEYETPEVLAIIQLRFELNERGDVVYRRDGGPRARAGEVAGSLNSNGYRHIRITLAPGVKRLFQAHRVAGALAHGRWPAPGEQVDHVGHDKSATDPTGLRAVSHGVNQSNQHKPRTDSKSGVRGVSWHPRDGKWRAQIQVDGKRRHLGYFESKLEAGLAVAGAKDRHQTAVPIVTAARIALDAFGIEHQHLDRPHTLFEFLMAARRHRLAKAQVTQ
jgi:hypothetical protein